MQIIHIEWDVIEEPRIGELVATSANNFTTCYGLTYARKRLDVVDCGQPSGANLSGWGGKIPTMNEPHVVALIYNIVHGN